MQESWAHLQLALHKKGREKIRETLQYSALKAVNKFTIYTVLGKLILQQVQHLTEVEIGEKCIRSLYLKGFSIFSS
jgi:hypothetical protein